MPIRYVPIPSKVAFVDPTSGKQITAQNGEPEKPVTFEDVMFRLMADPQWSESYHAIKAQHAIMKAMEEAKETDVLMLAEEDWQRLKKSAEFPRTLNYNPVIVYQLLPMLAAIMDATTEDPRERKKVHAVRD